MNINIRRAIALTFIIAFFITAPLLILYTAGYRYNFKKAQVQKTGTLMVKTTPKGAQVSLNGKPLLTTTPVRENNILPDEYTIEISKAGFYPWQKRLSIRPQETTFIEDVMLFPISEPEKINDNTIDSISYSPQGHYALFVTKELNQSFLYLINLNNFRTKLILNANTNWENISIKWAEDDSKALLNLDQQVFVATTIFPQQKIDLKNYLPGINLSLINFKWDPNDSNNLFWLNNNDINVMNLLSLTNSKLYSGTKDQHINDFLINGQDLYLVEVINEKTFLTKQKITEHKKTAALELKENDYKIIGFVNSYLAVLNKDYNIFFLFNSDLNKVVFTKDNTNSFELSSEHNYLAITTPQEVSYLNLNDNELPEQNLTRYSDRLTSAHWTHASDNYIFTLQNGKITILELDNRDKRFSLELPSEQIESFAVNSNDDALIFLQNDLLYQLPISK